MVWSSRGSPDMSLITELKSRNVFRVGVAYAIVAWLLIFAGVLTGYTVEQVKLRIEHSCEFDGSLESRGRMLREVDGNQDSREA
jgi:hypothetical protein